MEKKSYSELLKDPRWQKKRLKILERDNFTCVHCHNDKMELHIHHKKYSGNPWDSKDKDLETVCKLCHVSITFIERDRKDKVMEIITTSGKGCRVIIGAEWCYFILYNDNFEIDDLFIFSYGLLINKIFPSIKKAHKNLIKNGKEVH